MASQRIAYAIRSLEPDDAPRLRDIRLEALQAHPDAFGSSFEEEGRLAVADFAKTIPALPQSIFGAFVAQDLIGTAGFLIQKMTKTRHKGFMWGMYVRPALRGHAIGEALARHLIEHARKHVEVLQTAVVVGNAAAQKLYARVGFLPYGIERRALKVDGRYFDEELSAILF